MTAARLHFIAAVALLTATPLAAAEPNVGMPAPAFEVTTFEGKRVSLADFKGQVVVLNFWATWCGPCKRELPLLDAYYKLRQAAGLRVVAVTTEDSMPLYRLHPLQAVLAIPLARRFHGNYAPIGGVPTNYVIDRDGVLRYAKAGAFTLEDLNTVLVPLLIEKPAVAILTPAVAK